MADKPHPSCTLPNIPAPPNLSDYYTNLAKKAVLPGTLGKLKAVETAKRLTDAQTEITAAIERQKKRLEQFNSFSCPLPKVPDKDAGIPG